MEEKCIANWLTPLLYIITGIIILWLVNYDRQKGMFSSGLLFVFWLLVSLAAVPDAEPEGPAAPRWHDGRRDPGRRGAGRRGR